MTFASGAFGQLRYIPEVTQGVTPTTGNAVELRMTNPTMKAAVSSVKSNEISRTRMVSGSTNVDLNVDGGFDYELSGKEYDPFIESVVYGSFVHYGTNGLGTTFSCTTAANKITAGAAPTGNSAFTNLAAGILDVPLTGEEVLEVAAREAPKFVALVDGVVARL